MLTFPKIALKAFQLTGCAALALFMVQTPAGAETLSGNALKTLMVGKPISWVTPDGSWKGVSRYGSNGSASVAVSAPQKFNDTGSWRVSGNKFCTKWGIIRDGAEGCSTVRTTSQDGVYQMDTVIIRVK